VRNLARIFDIEIFVRLASVETISAIYLKLLRIV